MCTCDETAAELWSRGGKLCIQKSETSEALKGEECKRVQVKKLMTQFQLLPAAALLRPVLTDIQTAASQAGELYRTGQQQIKGALL
jgi:hypothetical protein